LGAEFKMTSDDALHEDASALEDLLQLSLLTAEEQAGPADLSWADDPETL